MNIGENLYELKLGRGFLDSTPKAQTRRQIGLHQAENFCFLKGTVTLLRGKTRLEEKLQIRRKYLQSFYLKKDIEPKYIRNSQNSIIRK